ncbi:unnamed protein product [Penicillium salamii]|uniref:RBR-type E3 ubiquitin transferase n=1 Tax=Penicillium salamii TaxID=1612424 RepID=A0A9W4IZQ6_9EURO|nr:unnamed protein product [Penicillium salamii]CAG8314115.1 unnamed protein product [Penicillium salamii]CAG8341136.1 unnamed protein product [Penicillium salamii]CAG8364420.1 unnamed protein product [Penicillium salamii]CAG8374040.1 unnamed protein product [Penicillium salamii]
MTGWMKSILRSSGITRERPLRESTSTSKVTDAVENLSSREQVSFGKKPKQGIDSALECVSCVNEYQPSDTILLPCSHIYCKGCVTTIFDLFIQGEAPSPPQCCGGLLIGSQVTDILGLETTKRYEDRHTEFRDPNKLFCSNSNCRRYILPSRTRHRAGVCEHCMTRTCVWCGNVAHLGLCPSERAENTNASNGTKTKKRIKKTKKATKTRKVAKRSKNSKVAKGKTVCKSNEDRENEVETPEDINARNDALLERLMKRKAWRRCLMCSRVIERISGCSHIQCPCGFDFCYKCSKSTSNFPLQTITRTGTVTPGQCKCYGRYGHYGH